MLRDKAKDSRNKAQYQLSLHPSPLDSSIQKWLNFDGTNIPQLDPCYPTLQKSSISDTDCVRACISPRLLIAAPKLLVTCGLWATLVTFLTQTASGSTDDGRFMGQLQPFHNLSLDLVALPATYVSTVKDTIGTTFSSFHSMTTWREAMPKFCAGQHLFGTVTQYGEGPPQIRFSDNVRACVEAVCSPIDLDPDLGGIGVSHIDTSEITELK